MRNALIKWIAGLAIAVSQAVSAAPVTDTVIVGSQEWAQVDLFTNVSWDTLNTQCPGGVCTLASTINGYDMDGWTWASIDTVQALFNTFTGQATVAPGSYTEVGSTWAPAFFQVFDPTAVLIGVTTQVQGWSSSFTGNDGRIGRLYDRDIAIGDSDSARTFESNPMAFAGTDTGAWFLRDASPAPTPATLSLLGLGLASIWISRRKRAPRV